MARAGKPPSSIDVARLAGVSQSAVSRSFTPGASVSAPTRAKVMAAADAIGYRPNVIPRIMRKHRSNIVAVVVGSLDNPYHTRALEAFSRALQRAGKQVMLVQTDTERTLGEAVGRLAGYCVDAVVSAHEVESEEVAAAIDRMRIPVVTLNSALTSAWSGTIISDNEAAGERIARLLHDRGGRRFGYVAGPADSLSQRQREAGFRRGLAGLGIADCARAPGDYRHGGGRAAARALFSAAAPPDAVFCANDLTAFGLIDALRGEFGLAVPGDVLVAGYDNVDAAAWPAYDLTTFDQRVDTMVGLAVGMLDGDWDAGPSATVAPVLVERSSTAGRSGHARRPAGPPR
ncbi:LacI family DNA-binding transcriptional regulator [Azospirillum sp. ST 5-10]|uniref:LacI family DNA-binding transcriptional regulator n=1 Tax=unclassified Azospirillum TaxID=2630922 RepID=UPI003F4A5DF0